jgi:hypothetical protein
MLGAPRWSLCRLLDSWLYTHACMRMNLPCCLTRMDCVDFTFETDTGAQQLFSIPVHTIDINRDWSYKVR